MIEMALYQCESGTRQYKCKSISNRSLNMLVDEHLQVATSVIIINSWVIITAILLSIFLENGSETSAVRKSSV
jgi:hypothetical protein